MKISALPSLSISLAIPLAILLMLLIFPALASCNSTRSLTRDAGGGLSPAPNANPAPNAEGGEKYPETEYLTAEGSGSSRRAAEEDAVKNLARIFRSTIETDTRALESYRSLTRGDSEFTEREAEVINSISIRANQELINVKFSAPVTDSSGLIHLTSYINREETGAIYRDIIRRNSRRISAFRNSAQSADSLIRAYAHTYAAYVTALMNERLAEQLLIINPDIHRSLSAVLLHGSSAEIEVNMASLLSEMIFHVDVEGDDGNIASFIAGELRSLGFYTDGSDDTGENAALRIWGNLHFNMFSGRYETIMWNVVLALVDENGRSSVFMDAADREQALDEDTVKALALQSIKKRITTDFTQKFSDYLTGIIDDE
ncbi:MAG: hypothetical protein ACR2PY_08795 [Salinispira sp.]